MGRSTLQTRIISLQQGIADKRVDIGLINGKLDALREARSFVVAAQDEADAIGRMLSYFALAGWAGNHANAFMETVGLGGRASSEAKQLSVQCEELIGQIDTKMQSLEGACSTLRSGIVQDERMLGQVRMSLARAE